jgi:peptidoglycan-associated lipoprotein
MTRKVNALLVLVLLMTVMVAACKGKAKPPVARPMPPPITNAGGGPPPPPGPPEPVAEPVLVPPMPEPDINAKSIDDLNRDSPLRPLYFELDSSDVSAAGQQVLQANAAVLKKYPTWQVAIEGHCDERGTAEYNLALGEKRARAAKDYLTSYGINASRVTTISYGKERPFDPGHSEESWAQNRRAHFVSK